MRRFFTEPQNINGDNIEIFEDAKHIEKVLRMSCGDRILVFDGTGVEYVAELTAIEKNRCHATVVERSVSLSEPKTEITLFQGLPKSGKMEIIVQKAVELGAIKIVPVIMDRCVVKINSKAVGKEKAARWNKVSVEAAKQCGRGKVPLVTEPVSFEDAVKQLTSLELSIMPYEELGHAGQLGLKALLEANKGASKIGIIVGPEGGFSEEEASFAASKGVNTVGLGKRILRTETVSGAILPVIMFDRDEF
ncbi:MAG: 16S rRNA (uracil(1498)-N(3))-methyltransferase [Clostridia bacterium]|nr:16S rRNA (uracil(1498)-N(3))-methyltransferase [Clostridia bacterium]